MREFKIAVIISLLGLTLISSCKDEPCDNVVCQNNGVCMEGVCDCPLGFEGEFCEEFSRQKILGNFDVTSNCVGDSAETNTWAIAASASAFNQVVIVNFHKPALDIVATITNPETLEIAEQFIGGVVSYTIAGSGTIDGDGQLSIQYTVIRDVPADTTTCTVDAIRQ